MTDEEIVTVTALLPGAYVRLLDRAAKRQLMSRAQFLRSLILATLRENGLLKDRPNA